MAISEQRLALFAMLSEFEADARDIIEKYISPDHCIDQDIGSVAYLTIRDRASRAYADDLNERVLLTFLDIGDAIKILIANRSLLPVKFSMVLDQQSRELAVVPAIRNRVMHRRPLEFDDLPVATNLFRSLIKGDKQLLKRTAIALGVMTAGDIYAKYAQTFEYEASTTPLNNLPQADFDDTGFMGRKEQIEELQRAISGPYPVITVLGVGGAGKSALALHVAYDVLNNLESGFDAVIWTTAKTTRLTGADVDDIVGAISSSVGIARAALYEFGVEANGDPFHSLRELLVHFKVLLFIDNLETILDERVRSFVRDIPSGSKIVFTSRIGLGAYDFVLPIKNLDPKQANAYFRRVASVWKQEQLSRGNNDSISTYCSRLNHSPLGIKWFIQAIAAGASPQRLLSNPRILLSFCLENIIDKLSKNARSLLNILAITGREQSPASLHYISDIDTWEVEEALRELIASNLITVIVSKFGEEDRYRISALAQSYISREHPPSSLVQSGIRTKQAQLTAMSEKAEDEQHNGYVFDPNYLLIRKEFSGTDSVAATFLRRAMVAAKGSCWGDAFDEVERAKQIAPSYFEVLRVEAQIAAYEGNTLRAQAAYQEAIALKPDYPPLSAWYAGFLVKALDDGLTAENILRSALQVDNDSAQIKMELARCLMYQHKYADSWNILNNLSGDQFKNTRSWRMYYDLLIQACTRNAEKSLEEGVSTTFCESMSNLNNVVERLPLHIIDSQVEKRLRNGVVLGRRFLIKEGSSPSGELVSDVVKTICSFLDSQGIPIDGSRADRFFGRIISWQKEKSFGFIERDNGERLFFHKNNMRDKSESERVEIGAIVEYSLGSNRQGICAVDIILSEG